MPRKIKIWGLADFRSRGHIVNTQALFKVVSSNYNVQPQDADTLIMAAHMNTGGHPISFLLPQLALANGRVFSFYNMNTGPMGIICETFNSDKIVASTDLTANSVLYGMGGHNIAATCKFYCDGEKYYHQHLGPLYYITNTSNEPYAVA